MLYTLTDFSPDGKRVLMTMGNGRGIIWDVDPESWERASVRSRGPHAVEAGVGASSYRAGRTSRPARTTERLYSAVRDHV